ncbi:hypothetical protein BC351_18370 [Paenibacillus ferrarius]|uniref:Uncharacterized protein n=2 Tax=Paenibacillus ferrarius TaxID=1469647 RepID=A0A1V4HQN9_9BACL|nr:hypothetical protein BC351_18370 [Paenibacillus ferrarius]
MIYSLNQVKVSFWLKYTQIRDEVVLLLNELDNYTLVFLEEEKEEIDVERKNNDFKKMISDLRSTLSEILME